MIETQLIIGNKYRFRCQDDEPDLMYIGKSNSFWHQFTEFDNGRFGKVWAEVSSKDLDLIEELNQRGGE